MSLLKLSVRDMFIALTKNTVVYGEEAEHYEEALFEIGFEKDDIGNYFKVIGENSTSLFCAHLDTAASKTEDVTHEVGYRYVATNKKTILGADDKAGVVVLLKMIEAGVPGTYYLFIGEEVGRKGSEAAAAKYPDKFRQFQRAIAFDRRGYTSIISRQNGTDCCSTEFVNALSFHLAVNGLFMEDDKGGSFTDTYSFTHLIAECTNLGIGYFNAHMNSEFQDILFLERMVDAAIRIKWDELPTHRVPVAKYSYTTTYGNGNRTNYSGQSTFYGDMPGFDDARRRERRQRRLWDDEEDEFEVPDTVEIGKPKSIFGMKPKEVIFHAKFEEALTTIKREFRVLAPGSLTTEGDCIKVYHTVTNTSGNQDVELKDVVPIKQLVALMRAVDNGIATFDSMERNEPDVLLSGLRDDYIALRVYVDAVRRYNNYHSLIWLASQHNTIKIISKRFLAGIKKLVPAK